MGYDFENKDFKIKDDGTVVRGRKCPRCGKVLYSEGEFCEYCGARIAGNTSSENKSNNWWIWIQLMLIIAGVVFGVIKCVN